MRVVDVSKTAVRVLVFEFHRARPLQTTLMLKEVNVYHTYLADEARRPGRSYRKEDAREY